LTDDVNGAFPGVWIWAALHPSVLFAFAYGADLLQQGDSPATYLGDFSAGSTKQNPSRRAG
jgi:hypothetical protein